MISMNDAARLLDQVVRKPNGFLKRKRFKNGALAEVIERISANLFDGIMVVIDPKEHKIVSLNDPYCVLSGGYGDSVLEKDFAEVVPRAKKQLIKELFQKLFNSRSKRPVVEVTIPIEVHSTLAENIRARVYCDESQICLLVDRSELVNMQEIELIRLKALISGSPDAGFWVTDQDGIVKDVVGPNCSVHLGYDEKEIIGMNIGTFTTRSQGDSLVDGVEQARMMQRRSKSGALIETEVVQRKVVMSNGDEYILHIDTYSPENPER